MKAGDRVGKRPGNSTGSETEFNPYYTLVNERNSWSWKIHAYKTIENKDHQAQSRGRVV